MAGDSGYPREPGRREDGEKETGGVRVRIPALSPLGDFKWELSPTANPGTGL